MERNCTVEQNKNRIDYEKEDIVIGVDAFHA